MGFPNDTFAAVLELERQRLGEKEHREKIPVCVACGQPVWKYPNQVIFLCRECLTEVIEDYIRQAAGHTLALFPEDPQRRLAMELLYYILDNLDLGAVIAEYLG